MIRKQLEILSFVLLSLVVPGSGEGLLSQQYVNQGTVLPRTSGGGGWGRDWDILKWEWDQQASQADFIP